jgi:hypothetical protein
MKIGDLVSIERPSIGIPKGTLAMITERVGDNNYPRSYPAFSTLFHVQIIGIPKHPRRYFSDDLAVIHAA